MRRVVVTGVGVVSPLGIGRDKAWGRLLAGSGEPGPIPADDEPLVADKLNSRGNSRFVALALIAADEAMADAALQGDDRKRWGVAIGSGIGGLDEIVANVGKRRVSPFFVPRLLVNMAAGGVSIAHGLRGPNLAPGTACAAGAHAIGDSYRVVERGDADVMVAGASEAAIHDLTIAGFQRAKALGTVSRPFDDDRHGFVLSEGAAVLVLEEREHALRRGANVYAEIRGYGMSGDAFHLTSPGEGAQDAMRAALRDLRHVSYVNAHAASTKLGDAAEARAIAAVLPGVAVSSTKGATGHLLGAAGALEAAFSVLAVKHRLAPHTLNLERPMAADLDFIMDAPRSFASQDDMLCLTNSFGFGGTNTSLLFASA